MNVPLHTVLSDRKVPSFLPISIWKFIFFVLLFCFWLLKISNRNSLCCLPFFFIYSNVFVGIIWELLSPRDIKMCQHKSTARIEQRAKRKKSSDWRKTVNEERHQMKWMKRTKSGILKGKQTQEMKCTTEELMRKEGK